MVHLSPIIAARARRKERKFLSEEGSHVKQEELDGKIPTYDNFIPELFMLVWRYAKDMVEFCSVVMASNFLYEITNQTRRKTKKKKNP